MILWVPLPQAETIDIMAGRGVTALVSPIHRGFVTALLPSLVFPTHLDFGADFAGINTQVDSTGQRIVVMMVGQRGRARALLRWNLPESHGAMATRVSSDDDVATMANELTSLFGKAHFQASGATSLVEALTKQHRGQADIVDAVADVIDLPELRERVEQRISVGPMGPSLDYPARMIGPTEVTHFTSRTVAVRSLSTDPLDSVMLAPSWSGSVERRVAVVEVGFSADERCLKIYQRDAPVAAMVWNERWQLTPGAPASLADVFLEELSRVLPWQWDRTQMRDLLSDPHHPDPLGEFGRITHVPSLEPLFTSEDWTAITPSARVIPRATGPRLAYHRLRAAVGTRLRLGAWRPTAPPGHDVPQPAEGLSLA
ncbi:MAG: hypothetical protein LBK59_08860 [Bifidobacteriaceae bacterium]|nr:hypothetical protein [Bifidobacteriaceae bacterium]